MVMFLINKLTPTSRSSDFVNHWYDYIYKPNWTQVSHITIITVPKFAISQSEANSTVLISYDIKSLT